MAFSSEGIKLSKMSLDVLSYHYHAELLKNVFTFLMTIMILDFHDSSTFIDLKSTFQYKKKKKRLVNNNFILDTESKHLSH